MEYRRGRITRDYRRWGRVARLARFRARSHSRNAYGGGQTGSFPFSEVSSHYEPSESCETNIRKRPLCPRVPGKILTNPLPTLLHSFGCLSTDAKFRYFQFVAIRYSAIFEAFFNSIQPTGAHLQPHGLFPAAARHDERTIFSHVVGRCPVLAHEHCYGLFSI